MNPSTASSIHTSTADQDLSGQARPGHGIPSQDPNPAAQHALRPEEAQREANSALVGGGVVAGMSTGAVIGAGVAGPAGGMLGAALGAVAGAIGGAVAGPMVNSGETTPAKAADTPTASSVHLHIEDSGGGGRPLVLIHGWPLSAQSWAPQLPALQAAGYRVVAYDRRGFGRSDKPASGYSYDTLADDLQHVMDHCGLQDVTLVGFSMGGGEVARYVGRLGEARLHSVVFAAAVVPYLMKTADNPDGPLTPDKAQQKKDWMARDRNGYFDAFSQNFFSAHGVMRVNEAQRSETVALCHQAAPHAALACMDAFATTDFRDDLKKLTVPTLVIHGSADAIVPIEGSGQRTHRLVPHSQLVVVRDAPHGLNVTHTQAFNDALLSFMKT